VLNVVNFDDYFFRAILSKNFLIKWGLDTISGLVPEYLSDKEKLKEEISQHEENLENIRKEPIKILSNLEWNNLNITLTNFDNKLNLFINVNGENNPTPFKLNNLPINYDSKIK